MAQWNIQVQRHMQPEVLGMGCSLPARLPGSTGLAAGHWPPTQDAGPGRQLSSEVLRSHNNSLE